MPGQAVPKQGRQRQFVMKLQGVNHAAQRVVVFKPGMGKVESPRIAETDAACPWRIFGQGQGAMLALSAQWAQRCPALAAQSAGCGHGAVAARALRWQQSAQNPVNQTAGVELTGVARAFMLCGLILTG